MYDHAAATSCQGLTDSTTDSHCAAGNKSCLAIKFHGVSIWHRCGTLQDQDYRHQTTDSFSRPMGQRRGEPFLLVQGLDSQGGMPYYVRQYNDGGDPWQACIY